MDKKQRTKITVPQLRGSKRQGQRLVMLTAYDATFARLLDACGVDILLVGDSLGMVIQGGSNTLAVSLEDVIYHTRAVARATRWAHVVADMPFMSYQISLEEGVRSAGRLIKEGRAEAVKIEGGRRHVDLVARLTEIGIPVMGHIGLTPQSVHAVGGYKVQGKGIDQARLLVEDALALQEAGAYSLVLESIPLEVARQITSCVSIPTIGIGAGPHCDGQVLVIYDLLGMDESFAPRFVKRYENLSGRIRDAVSAYGEEVRQGTFPGPEHSFTQRRDPKPEATAEEGGHGEGAEAILLYSGGKR
jgi:3-methyl-2-oxobutanoate hydroxymethyltransferase